MENMAVRSVASFPSKDAARKRGGQVMAAGKHEAASAGSDRIFNQVVDGIIACSDRMQESRARLADYIGLTGQQYAILRFIADYRHQDGCGIIEIAGPLRLSGAFVTVEVNKLVEAGLVRKKPNRADRRRVLLTTTPKARGQLDKLGRIQRPSNDAVFGNLSPEGFQALCMIIPQLVEATEQSLKLIDFLTSGASQGQAELAQAWNGK